MFRPLTAPIYAAVLSFGTLVGWAQPASSPSFEVASIKEASPSDHRSSISDPSYLIFRAQLRTIITRAYKVKIFQVDGPASLLHAAYSVSAKIPDGASQNDVPGMLQALLAEKLGLKLHRESRIQPVFELRVGKNGPKLTKSASAPGAPMPATVRLSTSGEFVFKSVTMEKLSETLSTWVGRPVLNLTEIEGNFDVELHLAPGTGFSGGTRVGDGESSEISSVLVALQTLGLRLVAGRAPIEYLVVDRVDKIHPDN